MLDKVNNALIIIDVQKAFDDKKWGDRNNLSAEENISKILTFWRKKDWQVLHIQHMSYNPNSVFHPKNEGFAIKELVESIEEKVIITKTMNSSFIGTNLEEFLKLNHITTLVITGFNTYLISDATVAFGMNDRNNNYYDAETIHNTPLANLNEEFATIITTEQLINVLK